MRRQRISKQISSKINKRQNLFDLLKTGWDNPDYSCIEIYWEILKPRAIKSIGEFVITDGTISSELAPQDKGKSYYTYSTIRRKLRKLEDHDLITINKIYRLSGCEYMTPRYEFFIKVSEGVV